MTHSTEVLGNMFIAYYYMLFHCSSYHHLGSCRIRDLFRPFGKGAEVLYVKNNLE